MLRRTLPFIALAAVACSQRSPWRAIEPLAPLVPGGAAASSRPSGPAPSPDDAAPPDATTVAHLRGLLIPVGGVDSMRLDDSFDAPRDGGTRTHDAIDIMAPRGTPVLAASDGRILRLMKSRKGGLTLYAADLESQFVYYYAHLDRYQPKVYSGKPLMRGDTLGFVGTTGNAAKELPHLHFQVMRMPADGKYMNGTPINPYPLLHKTASSQR